MAVSAVALLRGVMWFFDGPHSGHCPLAMAPLSTKDGHVERASVGERGSILLSHPLPIQPNCMDGARAHRGGGSCPFLTADQQRGVARGGHALKVFERWLQQECDRKLSWEGWNNYGRKLCLRGSNDDAYGCRFPLALLHNLVSPSYFLQVAGRAGI